MMSEIEIKDVYGEVIYAHTAWNNTLSKTLAQGVLDGASFLGADLHNADLRNANLQNIDLRRADLSGANFSGAYLVRAKLGGAFVDNTTMGLLPLCPSEGSFIAWTQAHKWVIKLKVLEDSKRSSGTTLRARCSKAEVLDILDIQDWDGSPSHCSEVRSDCGRYVYKLGEIIEASDFDDDRFSGVGGIPIYISRELAAL